MHRLHHYCHHQQQKTAMTTTTTTGPPSSDQANNDQNDHNNRFLIKVSETIPTLEECTKFVTDPSCGAISTFIGITRNNFQGKKVLKLSYEGYVPMAEKLLRELCNEASSSANNQYPNIQKIAIVHLLGDCPVGNASVIIACSSPHRLESIKCCEFLINELKARIPIWKLETYQEEETNNEENGSSGSTTTTTSVWKENIEWKEGKRQRIMKKVC